MDILVYGATSRFAREIAWVETTLSLCIKKSSIVNKNMFVKWLLNCLTKIENQDCIYGLSEINILRF